MAGYRNDGGQISLAGHESIFILNTANNSGLAVLLAALLVGCSTAAPRVSVWESIQPFEIESTAPLELPDFPEFLPAGDLIGITVEGGRTLQVYREASEANYEIAQAHSQQIEELRTDYNALARAGQAEFDLSELRKQTLEEERLSHYWGRITDFVLIVVLGVAAAR